MIGEIAQGIVQQDAVHENNPTDEIAFLAIAMHEDHRRF